jgi:hypothetical protein
VFVELFRNVGTDREYSVAVVLGDHNGAYCTTTQYLDISNWRSRVLKDVSRLERNLRLLSPLMNSLILGMRLSHST